MVFAVFFAVAGSAWLKRNVYCSIDGSLSGFGVIFDSIVWRSENIS